MKKIFLILFLLNCIFLKGIAQCTGTVLSVQNPSFEGTPGSPGTTPPNWDVCQPGTTPDTQPGCWSINLPPSNGSSYVGFCNQTSGNWHEGAGQTLSSPMIAGMTYHFTIDLATTNSTDGGITPGCIEMQIYGNMGGNGGCDMTGQLLWSSGNVTSLTWQTYTVTITPTQNWTNILFMSNNLGCADNPYIMMDNMTQIIPVMDVPQFTWTTICSGASTSFTDQSTSSQGTINSWSWNFGDGSGLVTTQNPTHLYAAPGTYNVTLTVTSTVPCTTSVTNAVTVNPLPTVTTNPTTAAICSGSNTICTAGGATTYQWAPPTGLSAITGTTVTASPTVTTTYAVLGTDANGCTNTASFVVTVNPNPVVGITPTNASCALNNGLATATPGGMAYSWSGGQTTQTISNLGAGNYPVTVTDANGCSGTATCTLTNTPSVAVSATSTDEHCGQSDGTATSTVTGGTAPFTYLWSNMQTLQNLTNVHAGNYSVTATDINGCTASASTIITNIAGPTLQVVSSMNETCTYGNGSATVNAAGGNPNYIYSWSNGGSGVTISNLSAGIFTATVTDANNCTAMATVTITNSPPPALSTTTISSDCGQDNGTATVNITGGLQPYNYNWGTAPPQSTPTASNLPTGIYSITVTDANNCTASVVANVGLINTLTAPTIATPEYCHRIDGTMTVTPAGGGPNYTYLWSIGVSTQTVNSLIAGSYSVTVSDGTCTTTNSVIVPFVPGPTAGLSIHPTVLTIMDGAVSFNDNSTGNIISWTWDYGDNTPFGSGVSNTHTYTTIGNYLVSLYVVDNNGCTDTTRDTVEVKDIYAFYIPNAFTPNGNGINDYWNPKFINIDLRNYDCLIFDRWGNLMYRTANPYVGWNGTKNNEGSFDDVVVGTYVYRIKVKELDGPRHEYIGKITIVP